MLRGLPTMSEKEMLKDWQEYVDKMIKEISLQLELNDYKYILIPEPASRVLRDMLYSFAQVGMLKIGRVMRWRELTKFLTPVRVSFDRNPSDD